MGNYNLIYFIYLSHFTIIMMMVIICISLSNTVFSLLWMQFWLLEVGVHRLSHRTITLTKDNWVKWGKMMFEALIRSYWTLKYLFGGWLILIVIKPQKSLVSKTMSTVVDLLYCYAFYICRFKIVITTLVNIGPSIIIYGGVLFVSI